jgi:cytosine deaminase
MELLKVKTARFADVVKNAGVPTVLALWADPRSDKEFQRAVRADRVMTVHQTVVGAKKDFAEIGFHPGPHVAYWLFPKSLEKFAGRRIIGIDYELLPHEVEPQKAPRKQAGAKSAAAARRPGLRPGGANLEKAAAEKRAHPREKTSRDNSRKDDPETAAPRHESAPKRPAASPPEKATPAPPPPENIDAPMRAAIDEAKKSLAEGGIPIGAALVRGKKLIATGHNKRVQANDPVTHAETDCLRNAGRLGSFRGCTLYSTLMPCYFCAGAAVQFGIRKVVVGESRNFAGAADFMRAHGIEVIDCDLRECREMLADFIRTHRKLWHEDIGA